MVCARACVCMCVCVNEQAMLQVLDIADGDLLGLINKQFDHLNADGDE